MEDSSTEGLRLLKGLHIAKIVPSRPSFKPDSCVVQMLSCQNISSMFNPKVFRQEDLLENAAGNPLSIQGKLQLSRALYVSFLGSSSEEVKCL